MAAARQRSTSPWSARPGPAYWIDDEYVYVTDYERGIDILKFDRNAPVPAQTEIEASWLAKLDAPSSTVADRERYICSLATKN